MCLTRASRASVLLSRATLQVLGTSARLATLPLLALTLAAPAAHAQVVFDNGSPGNASAYYSDPSSSQYVADTFTFASTTTFDTVTWFGFYYPRNTPTFPDNFTISFHDTTGGTPNALARAGETFTIGNTATRTPTGGNFYGFLPVFQYSFAIPSLTLGPGTYGISIVNDTTANTNDWLWPTSNQTGTSFGRTSPTGNFNPSGGGDMAFNLSNNAAPPAVPEPGELAIMGMLGTSVCGLMIRARRKAKSDIGKKAAATI